MSNKKLLEYGDKRLLVKTIERNIWDRNKILCSYFVSCFGFRTVSWNIEKLVFVLVVINNITAISAEAKNCSLDVDCLRCTSKGCMKCLHFITQSTRQCVRECPFGLHPEWSTSAHLIGRVCVKRHIFMGLSSDMLSVFMGMIIGFLISSIIIFSAIIYIKQKLKVYKSNISIASSEQEGRDHIERKEFIKQVEVLKPHAETFLEILNDTRKNLRLAHNSGDNSAVSVYKPIIRDLGKILLLLNRECDFVAIPDDWEHLFQWGEKTLNRCKRLSDVSCLCSHSQPQVAQLINFLQGNEQIIEYEKSNHTLSTFKPYNTIANDQNGQTSSKDFEFSLISPEWKFEYYPNTGAQFDPIMWKSANLKDDESENVQSNLDLRVDKDGFHNFYSIDDGEYLGYRPQDEITTEL